jgi:hypothetical protein
MHALNSFMGAGGILIVIVFAIVMLRLGRNKNGK